MPIQATAGQEFDGVIATFIPAASGTQSGDYSASPVNWLRGTTDSAGCSGANARTIASSASIPDGFAIDGFHANARAYKVWADHVMPWLNPPAN